jgi:hypothetical protein
MSPITLSVRILWALLFVSVASCHLEEPRAEDARAIYGCYAAKGAPSFFLSASGMRVEGSAAPIPFRYKSAKVGYGIEVPLDASRSNGRLSFVPSAEDYFYRRAPFSDPPVIIVAFGPDGTVVNYRRSEDARCLV